MNETPSERPIVLAITGASGAVYAARLLQVLLVKQRLVHLVISQSGAAVVRQELGLGLNLDGSNLAELFQASDRLLDTGDAGAATQQALDLAATGLLQVHHHQDYFTPIASGSHLTAGMVICPCSGSTLSGIARSASQNLIQRAAAVHLKEQRKLILVPRETPLSVFQLENMHRLAQAGVVILPAAPGWYHGVTGLLDLVEFVVARILDQLGIENSQIHRWEDERA